MDTIGFEVGGIVVAFIAGVIFWLYTKGKQSCGKIFPDLFGSSNTSFWSTHTKIHETLTELRVRTDSARAQVVQFHNSGNFFDGISMKKMSLTHESLENGVSSEMSTKKDLLLSMCIDGLSLLTRDDPRIYNTGELEDSWCKQFMENSNIVCFSFLPIEYKTNITGYLMIQWCSWNKADQIKEDESMKLISTARNLIEIQLQQEIQGVCNV